MRNKTTAVAALLVTTLAGAFFPTADGAEKKPSRVMQKQYCDRLFRKDWTRVAGELSDPVEVNGFKFGIGSKLKVSVDDQKPVDGVFLGRLVDMDNKTTSYMFEYYGGKKYYMVDAEKTDLYFNGRKILDREIQSVAETLEQRGDTCATYAVENFLTQLLSAKVEGNGALRKAFETKVGHADVRQMANDYYIKTRGGANFKPIFKEIEKKYGLVCKSVEAATAKHFEMAVSVMLSIGLPVLLEFYIPGEMVTSDKKWINLDERFPEDRRFWPPNARGQRKAGGHVVVAVEDFESGSGRMKLLINDSDWPERPIEWDHDKYFSKRAKSSGMVAWFCRNP